MGTIVGEIRAALGLVGTLVGLRRRRILVLERRGQLELVLQEAVANLDGIRRVWNEEHNRFNWRAWLHLELLRTRSWHEHKGALTTRLDGGPVLTSELAEDVDVLYGEFDEAARGTQAFASDWESRLVGIASRLSEALKAYPTGILDRSATLGRNDVSPPEIDPRIRTPSSPAELQKRALANLPHEEVGGRGAAKDDEAQRRRGDRRS